MAVDGRINDAVRGAQIEFGNISLDPASIGAGAVLETDVAVTDAKVGDKVFVTPRNLTTGLVCTGARVVNAGNIAIKLYNPTGSGVDGGAITYDYLLIKMS